MGKRGQGCVEYAIVVAVLGVLMLAWLVIPGHLLRYYSKAELERMVPPCFAILGGLCGLVILGATVILYRQEHAVAVVEGRSWRTRLKFLSILLLAWLMNGAGWVFLTIMMQMWIGLGHEMDLGGQR